MSNKNTKKQKPSSNQKHCHKYDDIIFAESVELERLMKQHNKKVAVLKKIQPYFRSDGRIINYDTRNHRYRVRIPLALRQDDRQTITAQTEQEVYEKLYTYFFGDAPCDNDEFTIRALFDKMLAKKMEDQDISSLTTDRYTQLWNKYYEKDPIADKSITSINASYIKAFFKRLTGGRVMSRKAFNNLKSILNAIYDLAIEEDIVIDNISRAISCRDLKFKAVNNSNIRYTNADRDAILSVLDEKEDKIGYDYGIELMFCLCIRIGELKALRWTDIDYRSKTITIAREIVLRKDKNGKNQHIELDHTKGGEKGSRVIPLSDRALKVLESLRKRPNVYEHIIVSENGNPINTGHFNDHLKVVTKAAGVPYLSSHKIRFWSVTELARATDGDLQTVMYTAGHSDKNTTLHYIRAVKSETQTEKIRSCFG